jgi:hypothetical protein
MTWNNTLCLSSGNIALVRHTTAHHISHLIELVNTIESVIINSRKEVARSPGEISNGLVFESTSNPIIVAMQLGPNLFKKENPELGAIRPSKSNLVSLAREFIVAMNDHFLSVFEQFNRVESRLIGFFSDEHFTNAIFIL